MEEKTIAQTEKQLYELFDKYMIHELFDKYMNYLIRVSLCLQFVKAGLL